jgi:flagellar biosynthesis/type III secretory pathway protein FliH
MCKTLGLFPRTTARKRKEERKEGRKERRKKGREGGREEGREEETFCFTPLTLATSSVTHTL